MTLSGTIRYIERIALMQPSVKMVVPNDIFRLNATPEAEYAVFGWTQGQHSIGADDSYATYSFTFFYVDRLTEDKGNQLEIQSVGITVLDNIIRAVAQAGVEVAGSYTFTSFNQRFVDECAGVFCAISLRVPLDSVCEDSYFDFNDDFNDDFNAGGLLRDAARGGVLGPDRDYAAPDAGDFYPGGEGGGGGYQPGPGGGGGIVVNIPVKDVTLDGVSVVVDKVAELPAYPKTLAELLPDEDHNVVTEEQIGVWNGKQDEIQDLDDIRSGAAAGETAYQKPASGIPASDLAPGVIPTVPTDMVKYTAQTLDDAQKAQARTNIGAGTYSKPSTGIPASDLAAGVIPTVPTALSELSQDATHRVVTDTEKATWNGKQDAIQSVEFIGSMYRTDVSGGGNVTIRNTTGQFPTVTDAGTYIVSVKMSSSTSSYSVRVTFGNETYVLSTDNGVIDDTRSIAVAANSSWSATMVNAVASGTVLNARILKAASSVTQIGLAAVTNDYNDLDNKPTIPSALSDLTTDATHRVVTDTEKATWNAKSDFSGSYNDLTDKPTIPAAQVNADWDAESGVAQILNKPTIPTVPVISTDIETDKASDEKTASPKAVYDVLRTDNVRPITSKTFAGVLALAADVNTLRPFFRAIPTDWDIPVLVEYRFRAYVPGKEDYYSSRHECTMVFYHTSQTAFSCRNFIGNTSYRPIYYNSNMRCVEAYKSIGHLVGINFYASGNSYSRNSATAGYERTFEVEIIRAENCTIEWLDTCGTVANSVTGYVAGTTHGSITNDNGTTQGETHSGDANSNTIPTGYCTTGAGTAAKSATCTYGYRDDPTYIPVLFRYANTAANATLAIASYAETALPIYVNGARTSASNTFGRGVILFLYYNNAYWCYNDGRLPIVYNGVVTSLQDELTRIDNLLSGQ